MTAEQQLPEGWKIERLGDVIDIQGGSQPPKSEFIYEPMEGYIQLLQIRDFGENGIPTFVPQNRVTKFCDKDDILIARYGASLGRIVTGLAGAYNVALAKTIFDKNLLIKRFVYYLLQTQIFQAPLKMISRSAQNGFAKHEIAHIEIPIPPLDTQQAIVNKIESLFDEIDEGIGRLKTAAQQIQQYRQKFNNTANPCSKTPLTANSPKNGAASTQMPCRLKTNCSPKFRRPANNTTPNSLPTGKQPSANGNKMEKKGKNRANQF